VSCIRYYRDGVLSLQDWLGSYRGIKECAWYAADDIVPFLRTCSLFGVRAFRKTFRTTGALFKLASEGAMQYAVGIG
jgi:hypothetical protein